MGRAEGDIRLKKYGKLRPLEIFITVLTGGVGNHLVLKGNSKNPKHH